MAKERLPVRWDRSAMLAEVIERRIFVIRRQKVMLDTHLAELYGVPTKRLNEQVRRNIKRFPADFMFQLSPAETSGLRSQFATSKSDRGGRRYRPLAFSEQGVAMLSSVLNSERAIRVNIDIMRGFVRLRHLLATHRHLAHKIATMEKKYDYQFHLVFETIRKLKEPPPPKKRNPIGFVWTSKPQV
jgi:hypothetical protein